MSSPDSARAVMAALLANLGIAISKFIAFIFTGSSSMLSEGVHSVADSGNQILLLAGRKQSRRVANSEHPFGYGRSRYVYAFIVSIVLFSLGGMFALYEGWNKIAHPEHVNNAVWAFGVLILALILEGCSLRTAIKEANHVRCGVTWRRFIHDAKAPELPVVLLEDIGALLGLVIALIGVILAVLTGDARWDGAGSLGIGGLLVLIAVFLAMEMNSLLIGESGSRENIAAIRKAIEAGGDVERIIHLKTVHLGPDELMVAAKIAIRCDETALSVARIIDEAELRIRNSVPITCIIYLEPDIFQSWNVPRVPPLAH
jgi:cation diffusion facilitator family transporter